ncbi:MAG: metal-dependent hydrolase [Alphaproteobacteria bacterium]|nr:metal-dependent hydrolase [Alphaproteobacteria bacterium]
MDSVTQFVLGAGVGMAVLGPKIGARRAALAGGVLGTLPDLDVFWPFEDPVAAFVLHRSATHSLVMHALATPILGEALRFVAAPLRAERARAYAAVFLCLATHALLDAMTIYGTRLFWPLWPEPVGLGSIFIIDPLYTVPLLVVTLWALGTRAWNARLARALTVALVVSTAYLGWAAVAQSIARARAGDALAASGFVPERLMATPTPLNTLFWRAIAIEGERYFNLYVPLLADRGAITVYAHPRGPASGCLAGNGAAATLAAFAQGFYRIEADGRTLAHADLRMGLTPGYVFRFIVAEHKGVRFEPVPPRRIASNVEAPGDLAWLWAGIVGRRALRPAETAAAVDLAALPARPSVTAVC